MDSVVDFSSTFDGGVMLEEQVSNLIARMYDYQSLLSDEKQIAVVEGWRAELASIHNSIHHCAQNYRAEKREASKAKL